MMSSYLTVAVLILLHIVFVRFSQQQQFYKRPDSQGFKIIDLNGKSVNQLNLRIKYHDNYDNYDNYMNFFLKKNSKLKVCKEIFCCSS